mgnify:CR=1 FL=1
MINPIVISDFDGTITEQDVNDAIHTYYGDEKTMEIEEKFANGEIGCYDSLSFHYNRLKIDESEFKKFVKNNIDIDPHFKDFYKNFIIKNNIEFAIVSGGFINYIKILFKRDNIDVDIPVFANKLKFRGKDIEVNFLHEVKENECHQDFGICGNCKYKIIEKYKAKNKPIIYIGDGLTDRCAVLEVDLVLAKKDHSLEEYCQEEDLDYYVFEDFKDVTQILKNIIGKEEKRDEICL